MRILFVTATRIGDAVLSTGLLDHLMDCHPQARVTIACGPAAAPLFEAVPNLERIIVLNKMVGSLHWARLWAQCSWRLWDAVVDLRNAPLTYLLATRSAHHMSGRHKKVGGHRIRQIAAVLGLQDAPPPPRLWAGPRHRARAEALIGDGAPVLAIGPTANWRAKTWRAENFAALVERLSRADGIMPGARVAVFGGAEERPAALAAIEALPRDRCVDLCGGLDLLEVFACLQKCSFYVGNDSGLMHIAAAAGVPTLGLFGPTREEWYAPVGAHTAVVRTPQSVDEIFPPDFDHRTSDSLMDGLTVDRAEEAARTLWHRVGKAAA